jgi:hypothetical protein
MPMALSRATGILAMCGALLTVTNAWNTSAQFVTSYGYDFARKSLFTYLPDASITNWFDSCASGRHRGDVWGYRYFD